MEALWKQEGKKSFAIKRIAGTTRTFSNQTTTCTSHGGSVHSLVKYDLVGKVAEKAQLAATYKRDALAATRVHLDVEMETGTGKTYCYIKTIFEMNKRYGWSKFIIMVPSIAIREGVYKSLQITADHFTESYGKKARFFIYNSKRLHELESFSSDAGINVRGSFPASSDGRFIFGIVQRGLLPTPLIRQASTYRAWLFVRFSSLLIRTTVSVQKTFASRPVSLEL